MHRTTRQIKPWQARYRAGACESAGCAMARAAIKRTTGTRKKPGETFRRGDHFLTRTARYL